MTPRPAPKVPHSPPNPLTRTASDVVPYQRPLWRIAKTTGTHPATWDGLRDYGPVPGMRWDPQHPPPSDQPDRGIMYTATTIPTVVAEVYQKYREVYPTTDTPFLFGFTPTRPLGLLDLSGNWPIRNGGAAALTASARKTVTQTWAAAILDTWPDLDGLWVPSTFTNQPMVVLFPNARSAFPDLPDYARPLTHPETYEKVQAAAGAINYLAPNL